MKKLRAYLLLFIFLFNAGGYLLLFQYLIYRSDVKIGREISHQQYNRTELVQVKLPMHLPNVINWENYEQISGEIQLKGHYYKYVGLKITRDTMFLLCLPNDEKTRLIKENILFSRQENDSATNKKPHSASPKLTSAVSEYDYPVIALSFPPPVILIKKTHIHYLISWNHPLLSVNGQPPELIA